MKTIKIKINRPYRVVLFFSILVLYGGIFYTDIKFIPNEISLLLPYVLLMVISTMAIGNKTGLLFSLLTISFWYVSKTWFSSDSFSIVSINVLIKSTFVLLLYLLIVYVKRLYGEVEALSLIDELTGLNNRRGFYHLAQYEINKLNRATEFVSLLFIDIDDFKKENDIKGHKEGDKILVEVGAVIQKITRKTDVSGRIGGDEFCILMSNVDPGRINDIAERIIGCFRESCGKHSWNTTLSIGCFTTDEELELEELIRRSDALMYKAKSNGKNKIEYNAFHKE